MTDPGALSTRRRPPRRRRRPWLRPLLLLAGAIVVFVLGLALGQVTSAEPDENGPAVTTVRTVVPVGRAPETVTVTTTVGETP